MCVWDAVGREGERDSAARTERNDTTNVCQPASQPVGRWMEERRTSS